MDLLSLTRDQLAAELKRLGHPRYRAAQLCAWIYERRAKRFEEMTNLPAGLRAQLAASHALRPLTKIRETGSMDTTRKFLFQLQDGQLIETVLIPASPALYGEPSDRRTVCISSQVGCAYGCKFCASGLDGVKRNLTAGEIVAQFLAVEELSGEKINNIVFMGMGEPFANYRNLMQAIGILNAPWGLAVGARNMTVSTSGLVPRIIEFADQPVQIRLAISLHAATDEVRSKIMPVNRRYPLRELMDACQYYCSRKSQPLTLEYILIRGLNDSEEQAHRLVDHARRLDFSVRFGVQRYATRQADIAASGLLDRELDERQHGGFASILHGKGDIFETVVNFTFRRPLRPKPPGDGRRAVIAIKQQRRIDAVYLFIQ